jgi:hypothetical protein
MKNNIYSLKTTLLLWFFICLSFIGCGVSKDEHNRIVAENTRLSGQVKELNSKIELLQEELDKYVYGEERIIALLEQAYNNNDLDLAHKYINTFLDYHPESVNNPVYKKIVGLIEKQEQEIQKAAAEAEREKIRQERLANIGKTLDNPVLIDGRGQDLAIILKDLIFDRKKYEGKFLDIQNVYFNSFGVSSSNFYGDFETLSDWNKDTETYQIGSIYGSILERTMESSNIYFLFHPSDQDTIARRFMLELKGKYYRTSKKFRAIGQFVIVGNIQNHIFNIAQFTYDGTTYKGILP